MTRRLSEAEGRQLFEWATGQPMKHYSVEAPHFSAAVSTTGRHPSTGVEWIIQVPPILRWATGKSWDEFLSYATRKGWTIEPLFVERSAR